MLDLILVNGTCITPEGSRITNLAVQDGKIVDMDAPGDAPAHRVLEARGKFVLPGIVDTHVHLPWPSASFDSVDDFSSGSRAAIHGGVTSLIEYVVPDESGRILPALESQLSEAERTSFCDFSFHLILRKVTLETLAEMEEVVAQGFNSFKIYTAYNGFRLEDTDILTCLHRARELGALICFHAEDGVLVNDSIEQLVRAGKHQIAHYPEAHPRLADVEATFRVIQYAHQTGTRIHIVHVNTREGLHFIRDARRMGAAVTGETCPQYLTFTEEVYRTGQKESAYYILAPVIRGEDDRQALWQALVEDDLQTIATDHCPYTTAQKTDGGDDFRTVPGGAGGIETSLPLIYSLGVAAGKMTINRLVEVMSTNPARIFNLYPQKGSLMVGSDADIVIYDPDGRYPVQADKLLSRMDHTLYEGLEMYGRVDTTILRGKILVESGEMVERFPTGVALRRLAYMP